MELFGDDFEKVAAHLDSNRSLKQIRLHAKWWHKNKGKEEVGFGCAEEDQDEDSEEQDK